jgi:3-ketosteroid 9alpha-monooxygenase subunit A
MPVGSLPMNLTGWFQIAWSEEIGPGEIKNLRYFGEELIAWRTMAGKLHVTGAYCEHLGAHLGHGGQVLEDCIQCPFHGWQWDGQGENVLIPYQDRPNRARRIPVWTSQETDGIVYVWHDVNGHGPAIPVPSIFELFDDDLGPGDYYPTFPECVYRGERLPLHPQFVMENGVDFAHFQFVHRAQHTPQLVHQDFQDHLCEANFAMIFGGGKAATVQTPDGAVEGGVMATNIGITVGMSKFYGPDSQRTLVAVTPVDGETSDIFHTVWLNRVDDGPRLPASQERRLNLALNQFLADLEIWKHQRYTDPPALATDEVRGFIALRRWAKRFYPETDEYQEYQQLLSGATQ